MRQNTMVENIDGEKNERFRDCSIYLTIFVKNGLQHVVDRKPIYACVFHGHIMTIVFHHPFFEKVTFCRHAGRSCENNISMLKLLKITKNFKEGMDIN